MKRLATLLLCMLLICTLLPLAGSAETEDNSVYIILRNLGKAVDDDNIILKELCKRTGLDIHVELWPTSDYAQNCQLLFASDSYPDAMEVWWSAFPGQMNDLIEDKIVAPLEELIAKYGPNISAMREGAYYDIGDGHIWGIPCRAVDDGSTYCLCLRQDWLDKLGLSLPTNWQEYADILRAFQANAELLTGDKEAFLGHGACTNYFFPTLGAYICSQYGFQRDWNLVDGNLVYYINMPGYREALRSLRTMYQDGLIDSECLLNSRDTFLDKWNNNTYGGWDFTTDILPSTNSWTAAYMAANPEAVVVPVAPFRDENGKGHIRTMLQTIQFIVFENSKHKENVIKLMDYLFSYEGALLVNYGIEGEHFEFDENSIPRSILPEDADLAALGAGSYSWIARYAYFGMDFPSDYDEIRAQIKECVEQTYVFAPTESYADNKTTLDYIYTEARAKLLTDPNIDFDAEFDAFIKEWNSSGGAEWTEELNEFWHSN